MCNFVLARRFSKFSECTTAENGMELEGMVGRWKNLVSSANCFRDYVTFIR